jgi:hypothetical protein
MPLAGYFISPCRDDRAYRIRRRGMSEDQSERDWTHWLMVMPLGRGLIALIGIVLVGIAIGLAVTAFRAPYRRRLEKDAATRFRSWQSVANEIDKVSRTRSTKADRPTGRRQQR